MIAHIALEHRPFFTVFRGQTHWKIVDAHQDVYHQPNLTVRESLSRILCLSHPTPARLHSFVAMEHREIQPTGFLDMTWQDIADTWCFVAVDLVEVWDAATAATAATDPIAVNRLPMVQEDEAARLLVEMSQSQSQPERQEKQEQQTSGMRLRSGRMVQGR